MRKITIFIVILICYNFVLVFISHLSGNWSALSRFKNIMTQANLKSQSKLSDHLKVKKDVTNLIRFKRRFTVTQSHVKGYYVRQLKITWKRNNYVKTKLITNKNLLKIFVHEEGDIISRELLISNVWEFQQINELSHVMTLNPNIQFVDIGAQLGVFTLAMANCGKPVIAVEGNSNNTDRLIQSLIMNNLVNDIKVLLNLVSTNRRKCSLRKIQNSFGHQVFLDSPNGVMGVVLEDLIPLLNPKLAIVMRLDPNNIETNAIIQGDKLFDRFIVGAVLMDSITFKDEPPAISNELIEFLQKFDLYPYYSLKSKRKLNIKNYLIWPTKVVWKNTKLLKF